MITASDKLSYETVEDRLFGRPAATFLNSYVLRMRAEGRSEKEIDEWLRLSVPFSPPKGPL